MTSTTAPSGRTLPAWIKTALLAALVFALCWAGAIAWWHTANSEPGAADLLLMLLALPCALLLLFTLGQRFVLPRLTVPAAAAATRPAPDTAAPAPSTAPLAILAAALRAPHGASAEELAEAIAAGKARADLDPELVDDKGFPVTAARREDAADEALQETIHAWFSAHGMADTGFSEGQWRALVLGTAVVRDLASHAASEWMPFEGQTPMLRLLPILPAGWTAEQRSSASAWLSHVTVQFGWPPAGVHCVEARSASCAFQTSSTNARCATLVIACESHIDQETVDRWETDDVLFTPARLQGVIPGEGAAGLLLADADWIKSQADAVHTLLDPIAEVRRAASIDDTRRADTRRADTTVLAGLVERACKQAGIDHADIGMLVADTSERARRTLELMGFASATLPHLESASDVACVGASSGACGAVPYLTALALAHHHALERGVPVLCISNEDAYHRCATLVRPAPSLA